MKLLMSGVVKFKNKTTCIDRDWAENPEWGQDLKLKPLGALSHPCKMWFDLI